MFALKIVFPTEFVLLRGNHETKEINNAYGFKDECLMKFGPSEGVQVFDRFNEVFSWLPLACLVGGKILCMHGGISDALKSLDDIRAIPKPLPEVNKCKLAMDLMWADPMESNQISAVDETPQYMPNYSRGTSIVFNDAAVADVCQRLKLQLVVRAHQLVPKGFQFSPNKKLVTIFSAPFYMMQANVTNCSSLLQFQSFFQNNGAILKINADGSIAVLRMRNMKAEGMKQDFLDETTHIEDVPATPPFRAVNTCALNSLPTTTTTSSSSSSSNPSTASTCIAVPTSSTTLSVQATQVPTSIRTAVVTPAAPAAPGFSQAAPASVQATQDTTRSKEKALSPIAKRKSSEPGKQKE
uniref:Serine/threonine-protein phosphatase n=1 Tax=Caenorhabditis japonica TaxID=281687 RepID=A0A8R1I5L7_CAEJA